MSAASNVRNLFSYISAYSVVLACVVLVGGWIEPPRRLSVWAVLGKLITFKYHSVQLDVSAVDCCADVTVFHFSPRGRTAAVVTAIHRCKSATHCIFSSDDVLHDAPGGNHGYVMTPWRPCDWPCPALPIHLPVNWTFRAESTWLQNPRRHQHRITSCL